jgi:S-DNA-T family DNA segregation ATPase FtsK/SpoIIIE
MADAPDALRAFGKRYRIPLTRGLKGEDLDALVRVHPIEGTWSALEYVCHMRDVLQIQRERLRRALVEDGFSPAPMGRDERVTEYRYNEQDPTTVADELDAAADALAVDIEAFSPTDFDRTMIYNYPERVERPLTWVIQHTVHEGEHHLLDVGRVQRAARSK